MVEVGPDTGALVVYAPAAQACYEVEIRRCRGQWSGTHTALRPRHLGRRVLWAGVFGSLPAGDYELRRRAPSPTPPVPVTVAAGRVTEAHLPGRS